MSENSRQSLHFIGVQWSARMDLQWTVVFSSPITCFDCSSNFDDPASCLSLGLGGLPDAAGPAVNAQLWETNFAMAYTRGTTS